MVVATRSQRVPPRSYLLALVLAVIVLVVHARVVLGGMTWDDVRYHTSVAPPRLAAATAVLAGEAPTWWDGSGLGVPLLGEPSHGAAYPVTWLAATPWLFDALAVLQLFWLALGVALWARRLGASELASMTAAVLVAASGMAASTALRGALPGLAHLPWVGWAALSLATAPSGASMRRYAAALGLALGAIGLSGQLAFLVDGIVLAAAIGARTGTTRWLAIGVTGGVAIALAQWLPALAIAGDGAGATVHAIKLSRVLELVLPGSFGGGVDHAVTPLAGIAAGLPSLYIGAPVFALAALAAPSRRMIAVGAAFAVLALVVGRGEAGWPSWLGEPELHLAALVIIAAAHAAIGVDALVARERRAILALGGAAAITALGLVALGVLHGRAASDALDRALVDGGIAVVCLVAAFVVAWRTRISAPLAADDSPALTWSSLAIAALVIAPAVGSLRSTAPVIDRAIVAEPPLWVEAAGKAREVTNPVAPLRVYRPLSLYEEQNDSLPESIATLVGATPSRFGLAAARSEDPARPVVHDRLWLAASSVGGALLERYGISLAILPVSMVEGRPLVELARRGNWSLAQFPATPPAAMLFEWIWIADEAAAIQRLFPLGAGRGFPAGVAVLRGTGREQQEEPRVPEPCTVQRWARGAIDLTCAAQEPSYAVVSSTNARGWSVEVDGADAPWVTADVMRRAVSLAPGAHVVSWRYAAPGALVGLLVGLAGLVGLLALLAIPGRRVTVD